MAEINFSHKSVLLFECIEALNIRNGYTYVDCTTGGGGHSLEIAKRMGKDSKLICFDQDTDAIKAAKERLIEFSDRITFVNENFSSLGSGLEDLKVDNLGGVLADLGCSSYQFDTPERGFSYMNDAPLDMRMNKDAPLSAYNVVNEYSEFDLRKIINDYGEAEFRARETEAVKAAGALTNAVIATGGGAPTVNANTDPIKQNSRIYYLDRAVSALATEGRPFSAGDLNALLKKRLPSYLALADGMIKVTDPENTAAAIIKEHYDEDTCN